MVTSRKVEIFYRTYLDRKRIGEFVDGTQSADPFNRASACLYMHIVRDIATASPSVCPSHSRIVSKRMLISLNFSPLW